MKLFQKFHKEIILFALLILTYLVTRTILLGNFPIFTDEALYVRWSQIASQDANWRFISLTDGKQPMLIWLGMIFVKIFSDPLVAVRLVSVVAGLFTMVGLFLLTWELFKSKRAAFFTSILYIAYPFAVVYDRMALYDSLVGAFAIYAIYFSVLLIKKKRLDIALILGAILGGGMLTKTSANFSILLLPVTILLYNFKQKKWLQNLIKFGSLVVVSVVIAEVMYNSLRLSPFFHIIKEKNTIFVYYPFSIPIEENIRLFYGNLRGLTFWLMTYLTPFYLILIVASLIRLREFAREKILLLMYFALPFLALALFGRVIFPRFIFFMSLYLLPLAGLGLFYIIEGTENYFRRSKLSLGLILPLIVLVLFMLYPSKVSLDFIFNPEKAAIPNPDKEQYITHWPAGGGVSESVKFFKEKAKDGPIFIGTEGTFGLMPYALEIYLTDNPNIKLKGYWPVGLEMPEEVRKSAQKMPTYFIFYQPCIDCEFAGDPPDTWPLKQVSSYKKSENTYYSVYSVEK